MQKKKNKAESIYIDKQQQQLNNVTSTASEDERRHQKACVNAL